MRSIAAFAAAALTAALSASQAASPAQTVQTPAQAPPPAPPPPIVRVKPIDPPSTPLPAEPESAGVSRFSFIAYGDTRSGSDPAVPGDGQVVHPEHSLVVDAMLAKVKALADTPFPVKLVVQSGDAVLRGANGAMWNVSFSPIIERLTRAGISYFFSVGNHDVSGMPAGDRARQQGLHNTLTAMSKLLPPEGSPRRLSGYPTYAVGYGNVFFLAIDSNIAGDAMQLAWVSDQLEHLDRARFTHVIAFFHHPAFSSGPHGGHNLEPASRIVRDTYLPLFRKHHVRMIIAGHDHLFDHWVERYDDNGVTWRRDDIVTGGGGAPKYAYDSEPDLTEFLAANATANVRVEHLARPSAEASENAHHFVVIRVDGAKLSIEVVASGGQTLAPYAGKTGVLLEN